MSDPVPYEPGNGGNNYSIKELLTQFVLPDLREIKEEMREKVSRTEFAALEVRLTKMETNALKTSDVERILDSQQQAAREFGISKTERNVGVAVALSTVATLLLGAHQSGVF